MECERLNRLVRTWYVQVQDESLAPARMVEFMEMHLEGCDDCLADPDVRNEVNKITELVLPPSKMTKPVKSAKPKDGDPVEAGVGATDSVADDSVAPVDRDRDEDEDGEEVDSDVYEDDVNVADLEPEEL